MTEKQFRILFKIVQLATVLLFLGRAYQHLFWDAPYRALLWDETLMRGIVELIFGTPWNHYITSSETDRGIEAFIKATGLFYLLCTVMALLINRFQKIARIILTAGSMSLILLAGLYTIEKFFNLGQFFEFTLQFSTPLILCYISGKERFSFRLIWFLKIAIAFTFICHGLYAINYYPRPGNFIEMTMTILGTGDEFANQFLMTAGILDFVVALGLFLPFKYSKFALFYIILWGFGTSIARIWANLYIEFFWEALHQWWFETAYRSPHFLIPLVLFLCYLFKTQGKESL